MPAGGQTHLNAKPGVTSVKVAATIAVMKTPVIAGARMKMLLCPLNTHSESQSAIKFKIAGGESSRDGWTIKFSWRG
jgi:hypothetical protein